MIETVSPERLKQIRLARGLSLDEVARRMDDLVTKQALSKYEIGAAQPRPRTLARLAEALRVSPELLREVVKRYDELLPTQRVTADGVATDISQKKDVNRYPSPRPGGIGYIWYDLNVDGVVSDLTATFDIQVGSGGLVVVLNEISVM